MERRHNPLDRTWTSRELFARMEWNVKMESLGSDHLLICMQINMAMNSETIKVKSKVEREQFQKNISKLDVKNVENLSDFIMLIEGAKLDATTEQSTVKNPKCIPKDDLKKLPRQKRKLWSNIFGT